jgi:ABC-type polysaccharide/polyol phosphate transport system ATPase subunit
LGQKLLRFSQKRSGGVLNTLKKSPAGSRPSQVDESPAIELVSISKWQGVIKTIDRRYVRNESLQTMIEVLISVRNANSVARGKIRGKPLDPLLKNISVLIDRGSIVGIIDIGGRSRAALMQIMSNNEAPSRGEIRYFRDMAAFSQLGIISYPHMSCREILERSARTLGVKREPLRLAMENLNEFSGLGSVLDTPFRRVPRGIFTDLGVSLLCCLDYDVLIADEVNKPRSKQVRANWSEYLRKAPDRGKTVVMNSRDLTKLFEYCTHLLLIKEASLLDYGSTDAMRKRHRIFIEEACRAPLEREAGLFEDEEDEDEIEE